jgi:hypothetical protein
MSHDTICLLGVRTLLSSSPNNHIMTEQTLEVIEQNKNMFGIAQLHQL